MRSIAESKASVANAQSEKRLDQYAKELDDANKYFGEEFQQLAYAKDGTTLLPLPEIAKNPTPLKLGSGYFYKTVLSAMALMLAGKKASLT